MSNALPDRWVESIFSRLLVRYGAAWVRLWEGIDMAAVRADWASELAGMRPEAISYGLRFLPADKPPTVQQFRAQCNRMPEEAPKQLEQPPADPKVVAKVLGGFKRGGNDPMAWALRLKARVDAGYRLNPFQRQCMSETLALIAPRGEA